jgi:hypothetical protein
MGVLLGSVLFGLASVASLMAFSPRHWEWMMELHPPPRRVKGDCFGAADDRGPVRDDPVERRIP